MLTAQQAETLILDLTHPLNADRDRERVPLLEAQGRILAAPVTSDLDFPHWDNSAMDGYAVRFEDVCHSSAEAPVRLEIVSEIPAGTLPDRPIQSGQAARILTGSMMPPGADTVVMQEDTRRQGDRLWILTTPQSGAFVRKQGTYYQSGAVLLSAGLRLSAPEIAVLAAAQCTTIPVYRRPRVAILSTGSELVTPEQPLNPGQIVDSNQYALASLVAQAGADPWLMGIVPDEKAALQGAIAQALLQADLILSSGGVSVGDYDYVEEILTTLGGTIHIQSVAVKPGKPLTVATFPASQKASPTLFFGLPGNPASALVSFWRFVLPALRKLSGLADSWHPTVITGRSLQPLKSGGQRETYLWGQVHWVEGEAQFHLASGSHLSGNLVNLAQTNGLAIVPIGTTQIPAGSSIKILWVS